MSERGKGQVGVQQCLRLEGKGRFMECVCLVRGNCPYPILSKNGHQRREDSERYTENTLAEKMMEER